MFKTLLTCAIFLDPSRAVHAWKLDMWVSENIPAHGQIAHYLLELKKNLEDICEKSSDFEPLSLDARKLLSELELKEYKKKENTWNRAYNPVVILKKCFEVFGGISNEVLVQCQDFKKDFNENKRQAIKAVESFTFYAYKFEAHGCTK